jgi:drug/metabolite transporter (DMT)-like permease
MTLQSRDHLGAGVGFALLATLGWSLSGLFVRLLPGLTGWQINCWRGYWMAIGLLCFLVVMYGNTLVDRIRQIPAVALWTSAVCFAVGTTFYVTSLTLTTTATVSVIGAMSPLVTGLLSPWITGEKPSLITWIAACFALIGALVIGYEGFTTGNVAGIITSFGVPFTFALQTLLLRRYRSIDMMPAICVGGFLSFLGGALFSYIHGDIMRLFGVASASVVQGAFSVDFRSMFILMLMGPVQLSIPLVFYAKGARHVPAITLALLSMLDAVLNPFWPWLFVNEIPGAASVAGGAIILGAVLFSVLGGQLHSYSRRIATR